MSPRSAPNSIDGSVNASGLWIGPDSRNGSTGTPGGGVAEGAQEAV